MEYILTYKNAINFGADRKKKYWVKPEITLIDSHQILSGNIPGGPEHQKTDAFVISGQYYHS